MLTLSAEALAERLLRADISGLTDWEQARGLEALLGRMRDGSAEPIALETCVTLLSNLNKFLQFKHACAFGEMAAIRHANDARIRRRFAQALINAGALDKAKNQLDAGLGLSACPPNERAELEGLQGRILKQRYVDSVAQGRADASLLVPAIDQYLDAHARSKQVWHAVNAVALLCRAAQDGISHPRQTDAATLAQKWLDTLTAKYDDGNADAWDLASLAEFSLALRQAQASELWMYRYAHGSDASPFHIGSTLRQLTEVWRLQPGRGRFGGLVDILQRRSAQAGKYAWSTQDMAEAVSGERGQGDLEKIFGKERFLGYDKFRRALDCCEAIGCVAKSTGEGFGTGFLVPGRALSDKWPDVPVFITNAHVIHATQQGALRPEDARVRFEVLRRKNPDAADFKVEKVLFASPPGPIGEPGERTHSLDVCIVTLQDLGNDMKCLKLTTAFERVSPSSHAYVIGHPDGAGLQVSLHDSQLLAIAPNKRLVHYSTPTVGGSSGSPVFNTDWEVFALHHAGSEDMPQFLGAGATYKANEGISIDAIMAAVNAVTQPG